MKHMHIAVLGAAALSCASASAETMEDNGWRLVDEGGKSPMYSLYTTDQDAPGVGFRCIGGRFVTVVGTKPADIERSMNNSRRARARDFTVAIGQADTIDTEWFYVQSYGVALVTNEPQAKRIYNAVTRDETIRAAHRDGEVLVDAPAPSPELFAAFRKGCQL